jgi:DNA-binding NtrC family response regulator
VDDERVVRRSLARLLRHAGFEVREAANGVEGIAQYQSSHYDLVIMDLDMPGMDGEEAHARLMELDPRVRVVIATGQADPARERAARSRGALAFLQKPVSLDTLLTLLREVLEDDAEFQEVENATRPTQGLPVQSAR